MTLYYCESYNETIKTVVQIVKNDDDWTLYKVFENDEGYLDLDSIGFFKTKESVCEFLKYAFKTVVKVEGF